MRKLLIIITVLYALSESFDSVIRWLLDKVHAAALIYLRDFGLIIIVLFSVVYLASEKRQITRVFWLLWGVTLCGMVAVCSQLSMLQLLFGLKVLLPFIVGFLLVETKVSEDLDRPRQWFLLWAVLCVGIILNKSFRYPWTGLTLQIAGSNVTANREWAAGSVQRLSGFSRSNYDGAIMILLLYVYLITKYLTPGFRLILVTVSGIAIALTTSKGIVAVFALTLILLPMFAMLKQDVAKFAGILSGGLITIALTGLLVPLISMQLPFPHLKEGSTAYWLFASLLARAWDMWPRALNSISDWQMLTGRGAGGIGAATYNFEPGKSNSADNLFVYLYVTAGIVGAAMYVFSSLAARKLTLSSVQHQGVYLMLLCIFGYGLTTNIIESPAMALVYGGIFCFELSLVRTGLRYSAEEMVRHLSPPRNARNPAIRERN